MCHGPIPSPWRGFFGDIHVFPVMPSTSAAAVFFFLQRLSSCDFFFIRGGGLELDAHLGDPDRLIAQLHLFLT